MTRRARTLLSFVAATALAALVGVSAGAAGADEGGALLVSRVEAGLKLIAAHELGDAGELSALLADKSLPERDRAAIFYTAFSRHRPPLTAAQRVELVGYLEGEGEYFKVAAARLVNLQQEMVLARQVLQLLNSEASEVVKVEALRAARPWTRMTHLFFLEKAMDADSEELRVEGITSAGRLRVREVPPQIIERITGYIDASQPPRVRHAALEALANWDKLSWEMLSTIIADPYAPESLRAQALESSDRIPEAVANRFELLVELVREENPLGVAWRAFTRAQRRVGSDKLFTHGLVRTLQGTPVFNEATKDIGRYLQAQGYRVRFDRGRWAVHAGEN